jgi:hypothetical protein
MTMINAAWPVSASLRRLVSLLSIDARFFMTAYPRLAL